MKKKEVTAFVTKEAGLREMVSNFWDVQHTRILVGNRFAATKNNRLGPHVEKLQEIEDYIAGDITVAVKTYPIHEWIIAQRGLSYVLAGQLIGIIQDVGRFGNISKLHAYFGVGRIQLCEECKKLYYPPEMRAERIARLTKRLQEQHDRKIVHDDQEDEKSPEENALSMVCQCEKPKPYWANQKRRKGILSNYNPKAKMLAYKIGTQFVKQGDYYRTLYDRFRKEYEARDDLQEEVGKKAGKKTKKGTSKGTAHIHAMAMRAMEKQFLADLWVKWRELEGLPISKPYVIDQLHHTDYESPP